VLTVLLHEGGVHFSEEVARLNLGLEAVRAIHVQRDKLNGFAVPGTSGPGSLSYLSGSGGPWSCPALSKCGAMVVSKSSAELLRLRWGDEVRRAVTIISSDRNVGVVRVVRL
jgi:hypothetical protein